MRITLDSTGKAIAFRPREGLCKNTFGRWNADTVLGRKRKGGPAVFPIVERLTGYYLSLKIDDNTMSGVATATERLYQQYGAHFSDVFLTITTDNGSESEYFSSAEQYCSKIYFAETRSAW